MTSKKKIRSVRIEKAKIAINGKTYEFWPGAITNYNTVTGLSGLVAEDEPCQVLVDRIMSIIPEAPRGTLGHASFKSLQDIMLGISEGVTGHEVDIDDDAIKNAIAASLITKDSTLPPLPNTSSSAATESNGS